MAGNKVAQDCIEYVDKKDRTKKSRGLKIRLDKVDAGEITQNRLKVHIKGSDP